MLPCDLLPASHSNLLGPFASRLPGGRSVGYIAPQVNDQSKIYSDAENPLDAVIMNITTVRIGLLGLGNIGQGVASMCESGRQTLNARGVDLKIAGVLEKYLDRERDFTPSDALITDDVDAFFEHDYDMVIEVLGGTRPAFDFASRALQKGIPVVTANKAMMAAHGAELFQMADDNNTEIRCEASAIAGVPYLSALRDRPLVSRVEEVSGIFNGTSNFILSSMQKEGVSFDAALDDAQKRNYAEPDPTMDVELFDAADKLVVIFQHLGITGMTRDDLDVTGIRPLKVIDFANAEKLGGTIKPVAYGKQVGDKVQSFVSPCFVPEAHPLATISYVINAVRLQSEHIGDLVFSGPGAGREVTAATILDDVVEIVTSKGRLKAPPLCYENSDREVEAAITAWFVRFELSGESEASLRNQLASKGVEVLSSATAEHEGQQILHILTQPISRESLQAAVGENAVLFRALS